MSKWFESQLVHVAIMYYKKGIAQEEIGNILGLSKMTISRMLQKALELKIITIQIKLPFHLNRLIGEKLEKKYHLAEEQAIVVKNDSGQVISEFLGKVGAFHLGAIDLNNKIIGSGVGNSIGAMVSYLTPMKTKNTEIIQLMGGLTEVSNSNPFSIVQELCNKLDAKGTFLTYKATVDDKKTKDMIIASSRIETLTLGKDDLAIFGIGLLGKGTLLAPDLVTEKEFEELNKDGVVGDICGHCFNSEGKFVNSRLEDRLVSVSLKQLQNFGQRIAIAGGKSKAIAIKGALLSGIITTIIIDEETAKEIV